MELPRLERQDAEPLQPTQPPTRLKTRKFIVQKVIEVVDLTED